MDGLESRMVILTEKAGNFNSIQAAKGKIVYMKSPNTGSDEKGNEIKYDYKQKIDAAVFPGLQGGPHMHTISGIAVALK